MTVQPREGGSPRKHAEAQLAFEASYSMSHLITLAATSTLPMLTASATDDASPLLSIHSTASLPTKLDPENQDQAIEN
jgi:hypothetical protein